MTPAPQFETLITGLVREIATEFIFHPEALEINCRTFHQIVSIQWRGHRADTPRLIGEGAKTYHQMRQLVRLIGAQHGYDADLARVGEPTTGYPERYPEFVAKVDWPRKRLLDLLARIVQAATRYDEVAIEEGDIGGDTSAVVIKIDVRETLNTETVLRDSLKHLAWAMFTANGRLVKLQVERSIEAEEQPETSAGRFAK